MGLSAVQTREKVKQGGGFFGSLLGKVVGGIGGGVAGALTGGAGAAAILPALSAAGGGSALGGTVGGIVGEGIKGGKVSGGKRVPLLETAKVDPQVQLAQLLDARKAADGLPKAQRDQVAFDFLDPAIAHLRGIG